MKRKSLAAGIGLLTAFALWTMVVCYVDVRPVGPKGSAVGLAGVNQFVHSLTGVNFTLYHITDWLGLVPVGVCIGFALLGLRQWISRGQIRKVDRNLLALGGFYIVTMAMYLLFERVAINDRPVLIGGMLEASYPSSTTLLTMCVMQTAAMQFRARAQKAAFRWWVIFTVRIFTAFMVIGRILSGVHWITDIVGGILLSGGLVAMYRFVMESEKEREGKV